MCACKNSGKVFDDVPTLKAVGQCVMGCTNSEEEIILIVENLSKSGRTIYFYWILLYSFTIICSLYRIGPSGSHKCIIKCSNSYSLEAVVASEAVKRVHTI